MLDVGRVRENVTRVTGIRTSGIWCLSIGAHSVWSLKLTILSLASLLNRLVHQNDFSLSLTLKVAISISCLYGF